MWIICKIWIIGIIGTNIIKTIITIIICPIAEAEATTENMNTNNNKDNKKQIMK